jgi:hypothetical protein
MSLDLNGPTIPSPNGVYHLNNPPNNNPAAIGVITLCVVLSSVFFLIRFYAKIVTKQFHTADCELSSS